MPENMSISVNGQSQVPPGFRFHPTEEELLHYYLRKKVSFEEIDLDVIRDVDLNKLEPWDIQEKCKIGTTPQNDWYFFSHKDKKYPTGTRTNRATAAGFWKATGRDKVIYSNCKRIGMRKTLVFYKGRAPHGQKSDWIMHEYRLDDNTIDTNVISSMGEAAQEEGWVVCRIFKKKNHHKTLLSPVNSSVTTATEDQTRAIQMFNEGALKQILEYMDMRACKEENHGGGRSYLKPIETAAALVNNGYHQDSLMKLPSLESPNSTSSRTCYQPIITENEISNSSINNNQVRSNNGDDQNTGQYQSGTNFISNWVALDRLVASQLNGQTETSRELTCFNEPIMTYCSTPTDNHHLQLQRTSTLSMSNQDYNGEIELWSFARSASSLTSSDLLCHVSNNSV